MKAVWMMILFLLLFPSVVCSQTKEIVATGEYVMGPGETMTVAAEKALKLAERDAAEQAGAFVKSYTLVKNLEVTDDLIEVTANHAMKIEVLEKKKTVLGDVDAIKYFVKIKAVLTAEEIERNLQKAREDSRTVEAYKALKADYEKQAREMEALKKKLQSAQGEDKEKILARIGNEENLFKANLLVEKGELLLRGEYNQEYHQDAFEAFTEAITLNPRLAQAYFWRSLYYLSIKENSKALSDINKALELQPEKAEFYGVRGGIYTVTECGETGRTAICEKALADIQRAIKLKPDSPQSYLFRGSLYREAKRNDKAMEDYSRVTKMRQDEWPHAQAMAYIFMAQMAKEAGDNHAALADYTAAIAVLKNSRYYAEKLKKYIDTRREAKSDAEFFSSAARAFHIDPKNEKEKIAYLQDLQNHIAWILMLYDERSKVYLAIGLKDKAESDLEAKCEILGRPPDCWKSAGESQ